MADLRHFINLVEQANAGTLCEADATYSAEEAEKLADLLARWKTGPHPKQV